MKDSLPQSAEELKSFLVRLDERLREKALEWAGKCYKAILETLDSLLAATRPKKTVIEHKREAWYQTCLGPIRVSRRQYRGQDGKRHCLLDELLGMGKYQHTTVVVQENALELASSIPYRRTAEILRKVSAIDMPHQTIWRLLARAADRYLKESDRQLSSFLETGEIPQSQGKKVSALLVEADGVMLSLQRERAKKAEVKVGIAYEGWAKVGKDRYQTINKMTHADVAGGDAFWTGMSLKLHKKYDLAAVQDTVVGGDGAGWVKEGANYINGRFQLDRYHLNRELCSALGPNKADKARVWEACERGDGQGGLAILMEAARKARGEQAARLAKACAYLRDNLSGLGDYRQGLADKSHALRRTGAMEGNVDKLVVRRMKNQGMNWTIRGIRRMLCVRSLVREGKLADCISSSCQPGRPIKPMPIRRARRIIREAFVQDYTAWLQADLPALYGPHAFRPWVRALKALSATPII